MFYFYLYQLYGFNSLSDFFFNLLRRRIIFECKFSHFFFRSLTVFN